MDRRWGIINKLLTEEVLSGNGREYDVVPQHQFPDSTIFLRSTRRILIDDQMKKLMLKSCAYCCAKVFS